MRKLTHDEQVKAINAVNPNVEVLGEIIKARVKVLCRCLVCGHGWNVTPDNLKRGKGCPKCAGHMRLTHKEQIEAIAKVNPNVEVLGEIINNRTKVLCRCKIHDYRWNVTPNHLKQGNGCPKCGKEKLANANRLPHAEQIAAIAKVNPDIEILEEIRNHKTKVLCRCKICRHEWSPTPDSLKHGYGCPECAKIKIGNALRLTHAGHVAIINKVNPDVEVLGEIKNNYTKVLCRCKVCGHKWEAKPNNLKMGRGCPRCAKTGFLRHDVGKLYIMVDDLEAPTMIKIGVSVKEEVRRREVLNSARKAGATIPALHVAKTWEGPTELMQRIESMMHENYEEWNIKFPAKFNGCTEFFQYTPETAEAFDVIEETIHEIINGNKAA